MRIGGAFVFGLRPGCDHGWIATWVEAFNGRNSGWWCLRQRLIAARWWTHWRRLRPDEGWLHRRFIHGCRWSSRSGFLGNAGGSCFRSGHGRLRNGRSYWRCRSRIISGRNLQLHAEPQIIWSPQDVFVELIEFLKTSMRSEVLERDAAERVASNNFVTGGIARTRTLSTVGLVRR